MVIYYPSGPLLIALAVPALAYVLRPVFRSIAAIVGTLVRTIAEVVCAASRRLGALERAAASRFNGLLGGVSRGENATRARNPSWDVVVRPVWTFGVLVLLVFADFYATALASAQLIHQKAPRFHHLPIAVLLGLVWVAIAAALGQLVFELCASEPPRPWNSLTPRTRGAIRVSVIAGLAIVVLAGGMFFVWRQGLTAGIALRPDGSVAPVKGNPNDFLQWPLVAILGVLLQVSVALLSWSAFAVLSLIALAMFGCAWFALASARAALGLIGLALSSVGGLVTELLLLPAILAERILELATWLAHWIGVGIVWAYAQLFVLARVIWAVLTAIGRAIASVARWIGRGVRHIGTGIRSAAIACARGIRAVALGLWFAVAAVGRGIRIAWFAIGRAIAASSRAIALAIKSVAMALWGATCSLANFVARIVTSIIVALGGGIKTVLTSLRTIVQAISHAIKVLATGAWRLVTSPFRGIDAIWNWICRFAWAQKLELRPRGHGGPPPRVEVPSPPEPDVDGDGRETFKPDRSPTSPNGSEATRNK